MNRQAIAVALGVALFALPLSADDTRIHFSDPVGDITPDEGDAHPIDIVNVDISSDGEFVIVAVTLAEPPRPTSLFQALVAGVAFDVDNDRKTGGQGFGGMHGDVPGIDFESEILSSVEDGAVSTSSAASVIGVDARGDQSNVLLSSDAPSTRAKGRSIPARSRTALSASNRVRPSASSRASSRTAGNNRGCFRRPC